MNPDFNYLIQTLAVALCVAVFIPIYLRINRAIPKKVAWYFYCLVFILMADGIASYLSHILGFAPDNRYELARILLGIIGYMSRPVMLYLVLLLMTRNDENNSKYLLAIPGTVAFIFSASALFTGGVFYFDEKNVLHEGPYISVLYAVLAVYSIIIIVKNERDRDRRQTEKWIIRSIIILMVIDLYITLTFKDIDIHEQIKAMAVLLYFMYFITTFHDEKIEEMNVKFSAVEKNLTDKMLEESIVTLAYAIDSKNRYTTGHSFRVAKYSRQIAMLAGKDEETCRYIYMAGLVHDIGKVTVPDEIISKKGKLTPEEYEMIKEHPQKGAFILKKMEGYPFIRDAAAYHHEMYDGSGYPGGLTGEAIPEVARIIAVANAYDAMTSPRSYRGIMEQADVKQEIWSGAGTKFDPYFAKLMVSIIDSDLDYDLRAKPGTEGDFSFEDETEEVIWGVKKLHEIKEDDQLELKDDVFMLGRFAALADNWATPTESMQVTGEERSVTFFSRTKEDAKYLWFAPSAVVFASSSGKTEDEDYDELGVFVSTGYSWRAGSSISESSEMIRKLRFNSWEQWTDSNKNGMKFTFTAHREKNKVLLTLDNELLRIESSLILPDGFDRNIYIAVTGEGCAITEVEK